MFLPCSTPYLIVDGSKEIEETLSNAKRFLKDHQKGILVDFKGNPVDADEEYLKNQVKFYQERYELSNRGIKNLRMKTKKTGDLQFERKAEENKRKAKTMREQYRANQDNQLPCCYIAPDGFGSGSASMHKTLEFIFTVLKTKNGEKMIPNSQNNDIVHSFRFFNTYYWGKRDFYGIVNSASRRAKYDDPNYIEDDEMAHVLSEWSKHYDETVDGVAGTHERAEIYSDIKDYVFAYKELKELKDSASTFDHLSIITNEQEILDEKRRVLLLKITNSTEVMKFVNSDKKETLELESVENADLEFQRKVERYRSIH